MTTTYFVSGHLDLTKQEFEMNYALSLRCALNAGGRFVVGDAAGCDYMAQRWLASNGASYAVYHMLERPRHCFGTGFGSHDARTRENAEVPAHLTVVGGFKSDEERDAAMTMASDADIAWVRPGRENSGTARNLARRRPLTIQRAIGLVGDLGRVRDYPCDCEPGGERFLVLWSGETLEACCNLEELRARLNSTQKPAV